MRWTGPHHACGYDTQKFQPVWLDSTNNSVIFSEMRLEISWLKKSTANPIDQLWCRWFFVAQNRSSNSWFQSWLAQGDWTKSQQPHLELECWFRSTFLETEFQHRWVLSQQSLYRLIGCHHRVKQTIRHPLIHEHQIPSTWSLVRSPVLWCATKFQSCCRWGRRFHQDGVRYLA